MFDDPSGEHRVIPGHDLRDVFNRFPNVESHFFAAGVHRMSAELGNRHLHRLAGAIRWLLEDQRNAMTVERASQLADRHDRSAQYRVELDPRQIGDVEEVPHAVNTRWRMATASSISASVTVNGGAKRRADPVMALVTRPLARHAV